MNLSPEQVDALEAAFVAEQDAAMQEFDLQKKLLADLTPMHLNFTEWCHSEHVRLTALLPSVIASIRSELEMPIDVEKYAKVFEGPPLVTRQDLEVLFGMDANSKDGETG